MVGDMSTGDPMCGRCGQYLAGCNCPKEVRGHYKFMPDQLTEDDIRRIVREELDRAKGKL